MSDTQNDPRGDYEGLRSSLYGIIEEIRDGHIHDILMFIFNKYEKEFLTAPGARTENPGHHAFKGGLAYHTLTVARLGRKIGEHYLLLNMDVNLDLIVAGILLHDIGKAFSYEWCEGPEKATYHGKEVVLEKTYKHTIDGKMLHHIPIGYNLFMKEVERYDREELRGFADNNKEMIRNLGHIVLSHHGRQSWSSPVIPQFLEAYIVHSVEMMDSYVDKYNKGQDVYTIYD